MTTTRDGKVEATGAGSIHSGPSPSMEDVTTSIHDRVRHAKLLEDLLGADLFRTRDGRQRERFRWDEVHRELVDGDHPVAKGAFIGLSKFVPYPSLVGISRWNNYAVLGPDDEHIHTITATDKQGRLRPPVGDTRNWLRHLLLRKSILPSYRNQDGLNALLIDVDTRIGGRREDLHLLSDLDRVRLIAPWLDAVTRIRESMGVFHVEWMLSGGNGFWVQMFFNGAGTRDDARRLRDAILYCLDPGIDLGRLPGPVARSGDITYLIDAGNLGGNFCRIPWSLHQRTQNVSINISPRTGQPDVFQFVETPCNDVSLSGFASSLPSYLLPSFSLSLSSASGTSPGRGQDP